MGPLDGDLEGASLSGDVSGMNGELKQELLRVELCFVRRAVDQKLTVVAVGDALLLHEGLNLRQVGSMASHICCQDDSDEPLAEGLKVIS